MIEKGLKPKILIVAMHGSPHTARWINLIAEQGWDLDLFPVYSGLAHKLMHGRRSINRLMTWTLLLAEYAKQLLTMNWLIMWQSSIG